MKEACPKCGSEKVAGLMQSFWVPLDENNEPVGQWRDWEANTELSEKRNCADCGYEWETEV